MESCAIAMNATGDTETSLFEVKLPSKELNHLRSIDSYATCPDNSVIYQDFTISERYAGGVTTPVRLGYGGEYEMGCPLKKL
jgi:hypothetical protein